MKRATNHSTTVTGTHAQLAQLFAGCGEGDVPPELIRAALTLRGLTMTALSRRIGRNPNAVNQALRGGRHRSRPVERAVAKALGMRPEQLWPERYAPASHSSESAELGLRIREMCAAIGSQAEAARRAGVLPRQMQRYIKGEQTPGFDVMAKLAHAANADLNWAATGQGSHAEDAA